MKKIQHLSRSGHKFAFVNEKRIIKSHLDEYNPSIIHVNERTFYSGF